jgi:WD40 repeat protein/tRNA A-37 threonylcarbamoyl transferase component Bud32
MPAYIQGRRQLALTPRSTFLDPWCGMTQPVSDDLPIRAAVPAEQPATDDAQQATQSYQPGHDVQPSGARAGARSTIPGYEIESVLGRGGMGVVYKARQTKLDRLVALKMILSGDHADGEELARFQREAEAVARLQHPNIVQVFEVGEADGRPFLALEFCAGGSLADRLRGTPLPPQETARLLEVLARAMEVAHRAGVIHRDLKPANILLQKDEGGRMKDESRPNSISDSSFILHPSSFVPKIADFGLAKRLEADASQTASGAVVGTPSYMAPEQARGETRAAGPPVDVYALGAVLYECLTGRPPFRAATPLDTLYQVIHDEAVPPSRLQPKVPRDLETVCLKCLEKEPQGRYESAAALADDLRRFLGGEPVRARPVGPAGRALKWAKRQPAVAALLGTVALVTALGFGLVLWQWSEALEQRNRADEKTREEAAAREAELKAKLDAQADRDAKATALGREVLATHALRIRSAQRELFEGNVTRARALLNDCDAGQRHWEHAYLETVARRRLWTAAEEEGQVRGVAFSPDSRRLVIAKKHALKVWDVAGRRELFELADQKQWAMSLAFCRDGRLVVARDIQAVEVWDLDRRRLVASLPSPARGDWHTAFDPTAERLAFGGADRSIEVVELASGKRVTTLRGHGGKITALAFSTADRLASASEDGTVKLWDLPSGKAVLSLKPHDLPITAACTPDGTRVAAGARTGGVTVWDTANGAEVVSLEGSRGRVNCLAFGPGGKLLAADGPHGILLWELPVRRPALDLRGNPGGGHSEIYLAFSPDGQHLAAGSMDGKVRVWDLQTDDSVQTLPGHTSAVTAVRYSPNGRLLATHSFDDTVKVWDAETGHVRHTFRSTFDAVHAVAFSPDSTRLAAADADPKTVRIWDIATGQAVRSLRGHSSDVLDVVFSPDGRLLASAAADNTAILWSAATGEPLRILKGHGRVVEGVAFSPDSRLVATASHDNLVKLWDAASGDEVRTLRGHQRIVHAVAFSPDGSLVASASLDRTVRIWETETGKEVRTLPAHAGSVNDLCFHPHGGRLATCSDDGLVKLWEPVTGLEILTLPERPEAVYGIAFHPDGTRLAAGGSKVVTVWRAEDYRGR